MGGGEMGGAEAGDGAEPERHPRHRRDVVDHRFPAADAGHVGAPGGLDGLHGAAAAGALYQADQRQAQLVGHLLAEQVLVLERGVRGAAAHGEVVAAYHHRAPVDGRSSEDEVRGREALEVVVLVVGRLAGDLADLVEAPGIHELVDPLPNRQASAVVLAAHSLLAAQLLGESLAALEFLELWLPAHSSPLPPMAWS